MSDFPEGAPCWADAMFKDVEGAKSFYGEVLGWTFGESSGEYGNYTQAYSGGKAVAAVVPPMPGTEDAPSAWCLYFASSDVHRTAEKIKGAGGTLLMEPMEVGPFSVDGTDNPVLGRMRMGERGASPCLPGPMGRRAGSARAMPHQTGLPVRRSLCGAHPPTGRGAPGDPGQERRRSIQGMVSPGSRYRSISTNPCRWANRRPSSLEDRTTVSITLAPNCRARSSPRV